MFQTALNICDTPWLIKRKGKKLNSIRDILTIFLKMSPQTVPCYVAEELSHLPWQWTALTWKRRRRSNYTSQFSTNHSKCWWKHSSLCAKCIMTLHQKPLQLQSTILPVLSADSALSLSTKELHVICEADQPECDHDYLVPLASLQQVTPPPKHHQGKDTDNQPHHTSSSTQHPGWTSD